MPKKIDTSLLLSLPEGALLNVLSFLSPDDLARVAQACRKLHEKTSAHVLWKEKLETHFPAEAKQLVKKNEGKPDADIKYREAFIRVYGENYEGLSADEKKFLSELKEGGSLEIPKDKRDIDIDPLASIRAAYKGSFEELSSAEKEIFSTPKKGGSIEKPQKWLQTLFDKICESSYKPIRAHQRALDYFYENIIVPRYKQDDDSLDVEERDSEGNMLWQWARLLNQTEFLDNFYASVIEPQYVNEEDGTLDYEKTDAAGDTLLHWAVKLNQVNEINSLLTHGAGINITDIYGAIYHSVNLGDTECINLLLAHTNEEGKKPCDINATNAAGESLLHFAAYNNHVAVVEFLLKHTDEKGMKTCDINLTNSKGWTPLHIVTQRNFSECCQLLLEHTDNEGKKDCKVNDRTPVEGRTPLLIATYGNNVECADLLLKHVDENGKQTCDINATDSDGYTALHYAAQIGYPECAKLLLLHGADVRLTVRDLGKRKSALDFAKERKRPDIINLLTWHKEASKGGNPVQKAYCMVKSECGLFSAVRDNIFIAMEKKLKTNLDKADYPKSQVITDLKEIRDQWYSSKKLTDVTKAKVDGMIDYLESCIRGPAAVAPTLGAESETRPSFDPRLGGKAEIE